MSHIYPMCDKSMMFYLPHIDTGTRYHQFNVSSERHPELWDFGEKGPCGDLHNPEPITRIPHIGLAAVTGQTDIIGTVANSLLVIT